MKFCVLILISIAFISCSSVKECTENKETGNLGMVFNTENDEYAPLYYNGKLYFTALNLKNPSIVRIFYSSIINDSLQPPTYDNNLPIYQYQNGGLPTFYTKDGKEYLIFAAMNNTAKRINSGLYISEKIEGKWDTPKLLPNTINTDAYESYPAISSDGKYLFFVSDREGGVGKLDIYYSIFENNQWSIAQNAGPLINSIEDELAPTITNLNELYFASNRDGGFGGFDIYKATFDNNVFTSANLLKYPINSKYDDIGCALIDNSIVLSSNRAGGCGGKDLYQFTMCKPIIYQGNIIAKSSEQPLDGKALLLDRDKNILSEQIVPNSGIFTFALKPNTQYYIRYFNACLPNYVPEQKINSVCSDSMIIKLTSNYILPSNIQSFDFKDYKIPFFVTGYYYPNTVDNLQALRLKFSYNIIGKKENTRYIENPGNIYDGYAIQVEDALNQVISYIVGILDNVKEDCLEKHTNFKIKITGFADSRPISKNSIYNDETINDNKLGINVNDGDNIDNLLLSKLRAYFTYKYINSKLQNISNYSKFKDKINWVIIGKGVADDEVEQALQRKVSIEIGADD